jgi:multidrug efflux system membrane fusion protein
LANGCPDRTGRHRQRRGVRQQFRPSQVTGTLVEVAFHEGDVVKQGQLLFQLDRRPFEAALAQAEANLTRDKALLAQAEAQLSRDASNAEYQQLTAERQAQLTQRGIISKDQAEQARAAADATAGTVKADKANIESARAQLVAQDAAGRERAGATRLHDDPVAD